MNNKAIQKEINYLKGVIEKVLDLDISKNCRERDIVDGRIIYSKILRDRGHTLSNIGQPVHKDHTTILHYLKQFDSLYEYDKKFSSNYDICSSVIPLITQPKNT
jgi:chromosomal replication initiation ATPase DnaA